MPPLGDDKKVLPMPQLGDNKDVSPIPPVEEEKAEGKGLKISTPKHLLTRLPVLLAQIQARNNSYKLRNEIRQIPYILYPHKKSPKNFITI